MIRYKQYVRGMENKMSMSVAIFTYSEGFVSAYRIYIISTKDLGKFYLLYLIILVGHVYKN